MSDTRELEARLRLQPEDAGGPSRMDMLRERIEAADALAAMRWIPVAEKMPSDGEQCLVYVLEYGTGVDCLDCDTRTWANFGSEVTHWRPLPAAPKE